ncbi:hypothetical protein Sgou_43270 [Streptomyces gougerotii]|uniref:Uncharacterized protein n=2 Tax=Streptomyces diastaticus group TaxID=2849069 RepID=A0A8H9HAQ2_9ACTN|nr:hypothetical protein Srut_55390 [Streptomyces rutgersensis]GFH73102.1 hypothetical protein Sdia_38700 [Streptomyces diastaticus subsp. diastaticus]GFH79657.1 hypothetical protein Sgou_43270 [Streptomyces gougerotii]GGU52114.1 hypothetical protein GCM10010227_00910 [Streptomyces gougerotii]
MAAGRAGSRYGPLPDGVASLARGGRVPSGGRDGADTEDDAAYMSLTDPFVCLVRCAPARPGHRAAPWGVRGTATGSGRRMST